MKSLYEIGADLLALAEVLDACDGDLSKCETDVLAWIERAEGEQSEKLDRYIGLIRQLEMESSAAKAEADQWAAKAKTRGNTADFLKARLKAHLEATGQAKAVTATGRVVAIQRNGGISPLIVDPVDLADVPTDFVKVRQEIDREAIRKALELGVTMTFARLGERGTQLRIR